VPATPREAPPAGSAPDGRHARRSGVRADHELLDARGCAACHRAIVDEWSKSRHALAWTNGIFQREYSARPQAWCVNCHAPLTTQQLDLAGTRAAQGVDCATCHVRAANSSVHGARRTLSRDGRGHIIQFTRSAPTAAVHVPRARRAHRRAVDDAHPMQTTVASFKASRSRTSATAA
jgi:hypothetical protein